MEKDFIPPTLEIWILLETDNIIVHIFQKDEREVYDIENEDFYSFVNEYKSIAEALVEFTVQTVELKELFIKQKSTRINEWIFYLTIILLVTLPLLV